MHAVGDQERAGAQMVGDHPVADVAAGRRDRCSRRAPTPRSACASDRCRNCRACPAAPPPGARAPCRCRSRACGRLTRSVLVTCSNCMKTRFQISMKRSPSASGRARRAAGDLVAVVVEDFRARAAGAGIAHRPEIVRGRDADDLGCPGGRRCFFQSAMRLLVLGDRR